MSDATSQKIEPVLVQRAPDAVVAVEPTAAPADVPRATPLSARVDLDQLSRIEEKAARIEEKFARSETLLLRVQATFEDAMTEFGGLARRADVTTLESRLQALPGIGALLVVAILAAILGAVGTVTLLKFGIPFVVIPR